MDCNVECLICYLLALSFVCLFFTMNVVFVLKDQFGE